MSSERRLARSIVSQAIHTTAATIAWLGPIFGAAVFVKKLLQRPKEGVHPRGSGRSQKPPKLKRRGQRASQDGPLNDEIGAENGEGGAEEEDLALDMLGWQDMYEWFAEEEVEALQQLHTSTQGMVRLARNSGVRAAAPSAAAAAAVAGDGEAGLEPAGEPETSSQEEALQQLSNIMMQQLLSRGGLSQRHHHQQQQQLGFSAGPDGEATGHSEGSGGYLSDGDFDAEEDEEFNRMMDETLDMAFLDDYEGAEEDEELAAAAMGPALGQWLHPGSGYGSTMAGHMLMPPPPAVDLEPNFEYNDVPGLGYIEEPGAYLVTDALMMPPPGFDPEFDYELGSEDYEYDSGDEPLGYHEEGEGEQIAGHIAASGGWGAALSGLQIPLEQQQQQQEALAAEGRQQQQQQWQWAQAGGVDHEEAEEQGLGEEVNMAQLLSPSWRGEEGAQH